ncbi:hypothetical protein KY358_04360 [Candidatus Woesearchaeota archaeon]|nr:hypothetical protein [Candidatus Woesearchaeota archaeon]
MEKAPLAEIRPNIKKAFTFNLLIVGGILALVISLLLYLHNAVGLGLFLDVFWQFGIEISPLAFLAYAIFIVLFITAFLLFLNYMTLGKTRYIFYRDRILYTMSFFVMQVTEKKIPYANITKVSYEEIPFFNSAKIIFDLTGMKERSVSFKFIDNPEEIVRNIHYLMTEYRSKYYAQYAQEYRMQNIMGRL